MWSQRRRQSCLSVLLFVYLLFLCCYHATKKFCSASSWNRLHTCLVDRGQGYLRYVIYEQNITVQNRFKTACKTGQFGVKEICLPKKRPDFEWHSKYSGDLKSGLVGILNGQREVGLQMVWILNRIWNPEAWPFRIWTSGRHLCCVFRPAFGCLQHPKALKKV